MYKWVSGGLTQLSTAAFVHAGGDVFKVRPNASTIAGTINGANSASVTDTAITGNLLGGIWLYDDTNAHLFNGFGTWTLDDELNGNAGAIHLLVRGGNT